MDAAEVIEPKNFIDEVKENPYLQSDEPISFFREYLHSVGARIGEQEMVTLGARIGEHQLIVDYQSLDVDQNRDWKQDMEAACLAVKQEMGVSFMMNQENIVIRGREDLNLEVACT